MRSLMLLFALAVSLPGCGARVFGDLKRHLHESTDRIEVCRGSRVVVITDPVQLRLVVDGISSENAPMFKCAYDGAIRFYRRGVALLPEPMEFNLSSDCLHVKFVYRDSLFSKRITPELSSLLRGI